MVINNKKFLGSILFNIIGWLMSMDSKDKDFLQSGSLLGFAGAFRLFLFGLSHAWLFMFIFVSFSLENGPKLRTSCHL